MRPTNQYSDELEIEVEELTAQCDKFIKALEKIADERQIYLGHGDSDIVPSLSAHEAQSVARQAITETKGDK